MIHNVYELVTDKRLGGLYLDIQKIQIEKERVRLSAWGGIAMFFTFLVIGPILLILNLFDLIQFLSVHFAGLVILMIATFPYVRTLQKEQEILSQIERKLKKK